MRQSMLCLQLFTQLRTLFSPKRKRIVSRSTFSVSILFSCSLRQAVQLSFTFRLVETSKTRRRTKSKKNSKEKINKIKRKSALKAKFSYHLQQGNFVSRFNVLNLKVFQNNHTKWSFEARLVLIIVFSFWKQKNSFSSELGPRMFLIIRRKARKYIACTSFWYRKVKRDFKLIGTMESFKFLRLAEKKLFITFGINTRLFQFFFFWHFLK